MQTSRLVSVFKRATDVLIGLAGTALFLSSYPVIAFLIRRESPGPVLFVQERIGRNRRRRVKRRPAGLDLAFPTGFTGESEYRRDDVGGRPFKIYKFRTMRADAEALGPQLCSKDNDPRVTRVGRYLRALHLDELPQFWNILKGDMSFVGPRPERAFFISTYAREIPHYLDRTLEMRPGLTGFAQIQVGYDDSLQSVVRKTHYDLAYLASMCSFPTWLRLESWILIRTLVYLVKRKPLASESSLADWTPARPLSLPAPGSAAPVVEPGITPVVSMSRRKGGFLFAGDNPADLNDYLDGQSLSGMEKLEICLNPRDRLDLEDFGHLVRLAQRVKQRGGRVGIKNNHPKVQKLLRELRLDKIVEIYRAPTGVRNFLTVDVECWFHAYNLRERVPRSTWESQPTRVVENVRRILDLFKAHQVKGTFFVLGWVADQFPEVVQMIDQEGHEIGTHGYSHNLVTEMTPEEFEEDLVKSLNAIAKYSLQKVKGHRASNFTIVESTLWALEILAKYGIEHDSSIFPINRSRYGIPRYPNRLPHVIEFPESGRSITEIPLSTLGLGRRLLPISGGGYLRLYPCAVTERYISMRNGKGEPAVLYFHPWELDPEPRRVRAGMVKSFQHYVNIDSTEEKIHRLLQRFRFTSINDNLQTRRIGHFLKRNQVRIRLSLPETADTDGAPAGLSRDPTESGTFTAFTA